MIQNFWLLETGYFKLDGGAMYGVVPKSIWNKLNPADAKNLCTWAMRCLLLQTDNRLILVDTGIGDKQDPRFFDFYDLHGDDSLLNSIKKAGFTPEEITDVVHTHLHFDHCGGAMKYNTTKDNIIPTFPHARYWSSSKHWDWAIHPNPREKASFLRDNILPIQESGMLQFIEEGNSPFPDLDFYFVSGHTESQMLPMFTFQGKNYSFVADLFPSVGHIPLPYIMAYDTRPLLTMEEKATFLEKGLTENRILLFQHDPIHQACSLMNTDKGIRASQVFTHSDFY
jgi:glyoxylase-like metal-dependent hydrolase (beta-lactamase superfamily II)